LIKTKTNNLDELIKKWGTFQARDAIELLDGLEYDYEKKFNSMEYENEYIEILKIAALLEWARVSFSDDYADRINKDVALNEVIKTQILNGTYKKQTRVSKTRITLFPIRHSYICKKLAYLYGKKLKNLDLKVMATGRVTVEISKENFNKTLALSKMLNEGVLSENIVFSGDDMFYEDIKEADVGIDDSVAKLALEKAPDMAVVNSSLRKADLKKRPNVINAADLMSKNKITPKDSVAAATYFHKAALERIEFNIGAIAEDEFFTPENIAQSVKEVFLTGMLNSTGQTIKIILPNADLERNDGTVFTHEKQIDIIIGMIETIGENYDIGAIRTIELIASGINNPSIVCRIYSDKGDFVFKALSKSENDARYITNFQNALYEKGLQVPKLISLKKPLNINKTNTLIEKDGLFYVLETAIKQGSRITPENSKYEYYNEMAVYNALIDNVSHSQDYTDEGTAPSKPRAQVYNILLQTEEGLIKLKQDIDAKMQKNPQEQLIVDNYDIIMEQIALFKERYTPYIDGKMIKSVSSFDVQLSNAFFDKDSENITGIFEFGGTSYAPRVLAFNNMFTGIYGEPYKEFTYKYSGFDIMKKAVREYNKTVNIKMTPEEIIGLIELIRGRFINNLAFNRFLELNHPGNIFSYPQRINYTVDIINQFKKFTNDFAPENINYFINYVLHDDTKQPPLEPVSPRFPSSTISKMLSAA
ncbi:MAG: hypothetical protein LBU09_03115, partial [Endomicrobium sp.]|nr:hypothetical protein [Endomicrobium sp.]